jgi:hypothetical protein
MPSEGHALQLRDGMSDPTITCPSCKAEIKLTESLAGPLIQSTRDHYEQMLSAKDAEVAKRERDVRLQQQALAIDRQALDDHVAEKLQAERAAITAQEAHKARTLFVAELETKANEVAELQAVLKERDTKLIEAQRAQADLIRKQRALDDAKREMDLTIETRVQESLEATRAIARREVEDELKLKVAERDQIISGMQGQIDELKRRAEQGSQQLQGEVQELDLERVLKTHFPDDDVVPVPIGERGGDLLHHVRGTQGQPCGTILWESKRTKNWSDGWLNKLRDDQRAAKADFAVIVSQTLPKRVDIFDHVDGVWVTCPRTVVPITLVLRHSLIELAMARQAGEGQQTKMEMIYRYLTGPRFRQRVQAIVEKFSDMHDDLERERKTMTKLWAKREEQIRCVIESTAGMYGDMQGIVGKSLEEIEGLELRMIEGKQPEGSAEAI